MTWCVKAISTEALHLANFFTNDIIYKMLQDFVNHRCHKCIHKWKTLINTKDKYNLTVHFIKWSIIIEEINHAKHTHFKKLTNRHSSSIHGLAHTLCALSPILSFHAKRAERLKSEMMGLVVINITSHTGLGHIWHKVKRQKSNCGA